MRFFSIAVGIFLVLGCAGQQPAKPQRYTAYNIWIHRGQLHCINYKLGDRFIPAGTAVKKIKIVNNKGARLIVFRISETNRKFSVLFNPRWHPGQTPKSYKKKMFTGKRFKKLTRGFSPMENQNIKTGRISPGMSKRAVLMCYGPPPEHQTQSLDRDQWYYWMNKHRMKKICFDANDRTVTCTNGY